MALRMLPKKVGWTVTPTTNAAMAMRMLRIFFTGKGSRALLKRAVTVLPLPSV